MIDAMDSAVKGAAGSRGAAARPDSRTNPLSPPPTAPSSASRKKQIPSSNLAGNPDSAAALARHRELLAGWIEATGDRGQAPESDIGLLCAMKRWGELCVNPEYDRVRPAYKAWLETQQTEPAER